MQYVKATVVFRIPVPSGNWKEAKQQAIHRWNTENHGKWFQYEAFYVEEPKTTVGQTLRQIFG